MFPLIGSYPRAATFAVPSVGPTHTESPPSLLLRVRVQQFEREGVTALEQSAPALDRIASGGDEIAALAQSFRR